jgi:hypothetical protein
MRPRRPNPDRRGNERLGQRGHRGLVGSSDQFNDEWRASVKRIGNANATITFRVVCLDFAPLHQESRGTGGRSDEPAEIARTD